MKNLICEKCETNFDEFNKTSSELYCQCKRFGRKYNICSGIYISLSNLYLTKIQICYLDLEFTLNKEEFDLYKNGEFIIKDYHYLSLNNNKISNIKKQLEFCLNYSENLLFL